MAKKLSKRVAANRAKVELGKLYDVKEAIDLVKGCASAKFDESFDVAVQLGIDPKKSDQTVRGACVLPEGTGKVVRVAVFTQGARAEEAKAAGADIVGFDDLADKVKAGFMDFDVVIASPDAMRVVGRLGQVLGPRGLMPNPKTGTVTMDVTKAIKDIKGGKVDFRVDKNGNLSFLIGKLSFTEQALEENFKAIADEVKRLKPSTVKGRYVTKATITSTMNPGVPVDPAILA